ncbi:MAG: hypothetical protein FD166_2364 [Bacteroidetes bacterium]|nr:MAG: hypothetical protein FD166_2364 [Bacteroidota bacterium]
MSVLFKQIKEKAGSGNLSDRLYHSAYSKYRARILNQIPAVMHRTGESTESCSLHKNYLIHPATDDVCIGFKGNCIARN